MSEPSSPFRGRVPAPAQRRGSAFWRGFRVPALLAAAFLAAASAELLTGCGKKEAKGDPAVNKGRVLYSLHCSSCHHMNPAVDGTLGPAVKDASLELLKARIMHGTYPPGYTPKRDTKIMQRLPLTEEDIGKVHAFLSAAP
jgi:mono/diheme cytochrome c family protein